MHLKKVIKKNDFIFYIFLYSYDFIKQIYYKYFISSEKLIKKRFKKEVGREVNLKDPGNFSDKIQWLKLYWYDPLAVTCADKYEVRQVVKEKVGAQYLNELIAVYDHVDEINLEKLPTSFVLKGTHGSGYNIICKNKYKMNWETEFKKMKRWFRKNFYLVNGEWVYKDLKPKIVCEKFISEAYSTTLTDYKIYCFNGKPTYCQVIKDRTEGGTIDFYDTEWNHMEFTGLQKLPNSNTNIKKPEKYEEMIELARKLSGDFPFVRVDFYYVDGSIYFGELTFFPRSGFGEFNPPEWNAKIGSLLQLPARSQEKVKG